MFTFRQHERDDIGSVNINDPKALFGRLLGGSRVDDQGPFWPGKLKDPNFVEAVLRVDQTFA